MTNFPREFLTSYGWDDFFESQIPPIFKNDLIIGRVVNEERGLYRVQTNQTQFIQAKISGKMQYEANIRIDYPAVGDWVLCELNGVIHFIFERKNILQRKKVGEVSEIQILASNVDYVFIATSLNSDLNFGRLERYLTFASESRAEAVILLTKADLDEESADKIKRVEQRCPGVWVHALSKDHFDEAGFFSRYLQRGKTSVIVGSSGVGKSTLVNYLIGKEMIATQEVRASDDKGKHTTTSRAMYESVYGGLIIDTPGMRELQFSDHEEGLSHQFADIEDLMRSCRFSNCHHETEESCAVMNAIDQQLLSLERWRSYQKLQREVGFEMRKTNKWLMAEERKVWKRRSMAARRNHQKNS